MFETWVFQFDFLWLQIRHLSDYRCRRMTFQFSYHVTAFGPQGGTVLRRPKTLTL